MSQSCPQDFPPPPLTKGSIRAAERVYKLCTYTAVAESARIREKMAMARIIDEETKGYELISIIEVLVHNLSEACRRSFTAEQCKVIQHQVESVRADLKRLTV